MAETAQEIVERELREFKRYTGDGLPGEPVNAPLPVGDPQSGVWNPKKKNLRAAMLAPVEAAAQSASDAKDEADRAEEEADRSEGAADRAQNAASAVTSRAWFDYVSTLLSDDNDVIGYVGSGADFEVGPGDIIEAQGFRYIVLADGVSNPHVETASGVKLNVAFEHMQFVLAFGADPTYATDSTTAFQRQMEVSLHTVIGPGNYKLSGSLPLRSYQRVEGAGRAQFFYYNEVPTGENITGTLLIQTAAAPVFTTGNPPLQAVYEGHIAITDLTVSGLVGSTITGTYGFYLRGSNFVHLQRVVAVWFQNTGIYIAAGVANTIIDCRARYCVERGLFFDYNSDYQPISYNAYRSTVIGGSFTQNGDANIEIGTSGIGISIIGVDIESAGSFLSTRAGRGIYISSSADNVVIQHCHLENNKSNLVVGDVALTTLNGIPRNLSITNNEFWSYGDYQAEFNCGRDIEFARNHFFASGPVRINRADSPRFKDNIGDFTLVDQNDNPIALTEKEVVNNFVYGDITLWSKTNCTVAVDTTYASPNGPMPVYKVTPSAAGMVQLQSVGANYRGWMDHRHTIGFYGRVGVGDDAIGLTWGVYTLTGLKNYAGNRDIALLRDGWNWFSIGRSFDDTDSGNNAFTLTYTADDTTPFYITAFVAMPGIVEKPYEVPLNRIATIPNAFTPTVSGIVIGRSGGTAGYTGFLGGAPGQKMQVLFDHTMTLTHGTNLRLNAGINATVNAGDTMEFICVDGTVWRETARMRI